MNYKHLKIKDMFNREWDELDYILESKEAGEIDELKERALYSNFPMNRTTAIMGYIKKLLPQYGIYWDDLSLISFTGDFGFKTLSERENDIDTIIRLCQNIEEFGQYGTFIICGHEFFNIDSINIPKGATYYIGWVEIN